MIQQWRSLVSRVFALGVQLLNEIAFGQTNAVPAQPVLGVDLADRFKKRAIDSQSKSFRTEAKIISRTSDKLKVIEKPQELKIEKIGEKYPNQWVTVDITKRDTYGFPLNGKVLLSASSIDLVVDKIKYIQGDLYTFYTGSIDDDTE